ncbi:hypothetical protein FA13DRAFT_1709534 [Coprinellus micaceus]|uniref:Uncharacterized protein n=1 Tax=Coprinellus micaceus TaxID=71717 RepID=A0A4Y7TC98_COPMI|nr:hypothetical protein FA13DRAFT_1709534 [Coprinellus micaceus]
MNLPLAGYILTESYAAPPSTYLFTLDLYWTGMLRIGCRLPQHWSHLAEESNTYSPTVSGFGRRSELIAEGCVPSMRHPSNPPGLVYLGMSVLDTVSEANRDCGSITFKLSGPSPIFFQFRGPHRTGLKNTHSDQVLPFSVILQGLAQTGSRKFTLSSSILHRYRDWISPLITSASLEAEDPTSTFDKFLLDKSDSFNEDTRANAKHLDAFCCTGLEAIEPPSIHPSTPQVVICFCSSVPSVIRLLTHSNNGRGEVQSPHARMPLASAKSPRKPVWLRKGGSQPRGWVRARLSPRKQFELTRGVSSYQWGDRRGSEDPSSLLSTPDEFHCVKWSAFYYEPAEIAWHEKAVLPAVNPPLAFQEMSSSPIPHRSSNVQALDPKVTVSHFLLQVQSAHVRTRDREPVPLHFDSKTDTLVPYIWYSNPTLQNVYGRLPVNPATGERLSPDEIESHRRTHELRGPCCLCAHLEGGDYTEARIGIAETLTKDLTRSHSILKGEIVAVFLWLLKMFRWWKLMSPSGQETDFFQVMSDAVIRAKRPRALEIVYPRKKVNKELIRDLAKGITEERFWATFVQCLICKGIIFRETFGANHVCDIEQPKRRRYSPYPTKQQGGPSSSKRPVPSRLQRTYAFSIRSSPTPTEPVQSGEHSPEDAGAVSEDELPVLSSYSKVKGQDGIQLVLAPAWLLSLQNPRCEGYYYSLENSTEAGAHGVQGLTARGPQLLGYTGAYTSGIKEG